MGNLNNSLNNFSQNLPPNRLPIPKKFEELTECDLGALIESSPDRQEMGDGQKDAIRRAFQTVFVNEQCGYIKGKTILSAMTSGQQIKCSALARMILPKELAAFKSNVLSYEQFKARNGYESVNLFTEKEKDQFRKKVFEILQQTRPGLVKAIEKFGDEMCHLMGIQDQQIASAVIPNEIEALQSGKMNYQRFLERNTYYVFDNMTEEEFKIARTAFLKLGQDALESKEFEIDRDILLES